MVNKNWILIAKLTMKCLFHIVVISTLLYAVDHWLGFDGAPYALIGMFLASKWLDEYNILQRN